MGKGIRPRHLASIFVLLLVLLVRSGVAEEPVVSFQGKSYQWTDQNEAGSSSVVRAGLVADWASREASSQIRESIKTQTASVPENLVEEGLVFMREFRRKHFPLNPELFALIRDLKSRGVPTDKDLSAVYLANQELLKGAGYEDESLWISEARRMVSCTSCVFPVTEEEMDEVDRGWLRSYIGRYIEASRAIDFEAELGKAENRAKARHALETLANRVPSESDVDVALQEMLLLRQERVSATKAARGGIEVSDPALRAEVLAVLDKRLESESRLEIYDHAVLSETNGFLPIRTILAATRTAGTPMAKGEASAESRIPRYSSPVIIKLDGTSLREDAPAFYLLTAPWFEDVGAQLERSDGEALAAKYGVAGNRIVCVLWRDGQVLASADLLRGGPPYHLGRIPLESVDQMLTSGTLAQRAAEQDLARLTFVGFDTQRCEIFLSNTKGDRLALWTELDIVARAVETRDEDLFDFLDEEGKRWSRYQVEFVYQQTVFLEARKELLDCLPENYRSWDKQEGLMVLITAMK